jgi:hypothetical protein
VQKFICRVCLDMIYNFLLGNFIGQHRPSAAIVCCTFLSDCCKNDFLCKAEISGFNVCSNTRECVDLANTIHERH